MAASRPTLGQHHARHPGDVLRVVLGGLIVFVTSLAIHQHTIGIRETNVFRLVNDLALPGWTHPGVWLVMQLGVIGAVPLVVGLALILKRWRLALDAALAGGAIYFIAKIIKSYVQRGRPQTLLDNVHILGEPARGLGYVSGHSAVAVALATVASPYLGRRGRRVAWTLAACVCLARMYVGAHLPFDVLGGAALGWAAGALVHLVLGAPKVRPSVAKVRKALEQNGLDASGLEAVGGEMGRSTALRTADGSDLFLKVVTREWRDRDLLYRAWRRLTPWRGPQPQRVGNPYHEVEHEASLALLAAAAGVRTPQILLVNSFGNGNGLLVQRLVKGHNLAELGADQVDDALLAESWRQVATLHSARIAHGDLGLTSVVVDADGQPWLVDFDRAVAAADPSLLQDDVAALLDALSGLVGPERANAAARAVLGPDAFTRPAPAAAAADP
jgi:glycosyltransferase 2 family protein